MKFPLLLGFAALLTLAVFLPKSARAAAPETLPLWPEGAPGALGTKPQDVPTITWFPAVPAATNAPALVIFPGGGYGSLAEHEGAGYAEFFRQFGIQCFVVKYRLGSHGYRHPAMLQDAARAVRMVRSKAAEWNVDPKRIIAIGSSAGGHLASTLETHFDAGDAAAKDPIQRQSSRPDYAILCYPVITMTELTHGGSRRNLLGENPSPELIKELSNELHATKETPPTFIWTTTEDRVVDPENSILFAEALRKAAVPFALHIFQKGGHGQGLGNAKTPGQHLPWVDDCLYWLRENGIIAPAK